MTKRWILVLGALVALLAVPAVVSANGLVVGDANLDGKTTMADAMTIMRYRAGLEEFNADQLKCADTTADGKVTMADAMHIMQFRADPDGSAGILSKPIYDPVFHSGMIDPLTL